MSLTSAPHWWKPLAAASPFTAGIEGPVWGISRRTSAAGDRQHRPDSGRSARFQSYRKV
jgi:hypothetical protein